MGSTLEHTADKYGATSFVGISIGARRAIRAIEVVRDLGIRHEFPYGLKIILDGGDPATSVRTEPVNISREIGGFDSAKINVDSPRSLNGPIVGSGGFAPLLVGATIENWGFSRYAY